MLANTGRIQKTFGLWSAAVVLVLAACQAAPTAAPTATAPGPATRLATSTGRPTPVVTATPLPADTATAISTATAASARPTATLAASATTTETPPETEAPVRPTAPPSATARPTRPPVTSTPLGPPETGSIYSTSSGPAGYATTLKCVRAGAPCAARMPPGDVNFNLTLASTAAAPWTHFIYFGLAVEKDGRNVAEAFMFADTGWLQPGTVVGPTTSRNFSQPGTYVMRSSGCLTTDVKATQCVWATLAGDVVTFTIQ